MKRLTFYGYLFPFGAFLYPLIGQAQTPDQATIDQAVNGVAMNNWWLALGPLITLLVWVLRDFVAKPLPKVQAFLNQPAVSYLMPVVLGIAAGLGKAAQAGEKPTVGLISGVVIAALSKLTFLGVKNFAEQTSAAVKAPPAGMLVALVLGAALASSPANAQALTVGPSLPAFAITPGAGHPVTLAAGAGITVGSDFFPTTLLEQKVHWLTVGLDAFGSLTPVGSAVGGSASMGLHVCTLGLFCVGGGVKLLDSGGAGAIDGKLDHRSFFVLFEPDCRVMKLLWPAISGPAPAAEPDTPVDGDHPNGPNGVGGGTEGGPGGSGPTGAAK